jgi:predicted SPOUT superfamily RNA methylase MTH1
VIGLLNNKIKFDIAIPDSFLYGIKSEIDSTLKIFQLARALSIFRVENIHIFHDRIINPLSSEVDLIITLLEYLDTPQYLRKKIYPKLDSLKYVGKLHPIRSPHHKDKKPLNSIINGEVRVGILEKKGDTFYADVGLESQIKYLGKIKQTGKKINVKLDRKNNYLYAFDIDEHNIDEIYWGYKVSYFNSLYDILKRYKKLNIILTSKNSEYFKPESQFSNQLRDCKNINTSILIVFGSPKFGLKEILNKERLDISKYHSFNFFPFQGTQTIRLEESIFGVLSILNNYIFA